jgi:hypothetical protein
VAEPHLSGVKPSKRRPDVQVTNSEKNQAELSKNTTDEMFVGSPITGLPLVGENVSGPDMTAAVTPNASHG